MNVNIDIHTFRSKEEAIAFKFIYTEVSEMKISGKRVDIYPIHGYFTTGILYIIFFNDMFCDRGNQQDDAYNQDHYDSQNDGTDF